MIESLLGQLPREYLTYLRSLPVGIALPGNVLPDMRVCHRCPNLPDWLDVNVAEELSRRLRRVLEGVGISEVEVRAVNDVNAATWGEYVHLLKQGLVDEDVHMLHIAIGTGVGGGLILGGKLLVGRRGLAGEIGHITVDPSDEAPLCGCGNRGCLEAHASAKAIRRKVKERLGLDIDVKELAEMARKGAGKAIEIFEEVGRFLGIGIAAINYVVDLDIVVLSGGVSRAFDLLGPALKEELSRRVKMVQVKPDEMIRLAVLEKPHLIGAALLGAERSYSKV